MISQNSRQPLVVIKSHWPLIIISLLSLLVYWTTSGGDTPYNYFTRLADAFMHGRYWLTQNPSHLNELIPAAANRFFVVYPPMPALIAIPFVAIFGITFPQQYLAHLIGALLPIAMYFLAKSQLKSQSKAIYLTLAAAFGTIGWFLASNGSAWYYAQVTAATFLTLALLESYTRNRGLIIGFFLGAAYLARLPVMLAAPFFLYRLWNQKPSRAPIIHFFLGITPFLIGNFSYNFIRFGTIFDKGYILIPGVLEEPWYQHGLFHYRNIPAHLKIMFTSLPRRIQEFPYLTPSWAGLAIWITSPFFIYVLPTIKKIKTTLPIWLTIAAIALVHFTHGTTGFAQFGYRFAYDYYPLLFLLLIIHVKSINALRWHHWLLLSIAIAVNLWGTTWINLFGWVGY